METEMSMIRCDDCEAIFDSDADPDCFCEPKVLCSFCRPEIDDDDALVSSHHLLPKGE